MSRKLRRVPKNWQHPKNNRGQYLPMHDQDFDAAAEEWLTANAAWENGENPDRAEQEQEIGERMYYWEWSGSPPNDKDFYRPQWTAAEATCFQIYENVSEGTPVSPVFETKDEVADFLVGQGISRFAAEEFCRLELTVSMAVINGAFAEY